MKTPATININGKEIELETLNPSKGGQKKYRAMAHVRGLGTVYVTVYTGVPKLESASTTMLQIADTLKSISTRLDSVERRFEIERTPHFSPPSRPVPPPHPSA